jgi:hypothetical protein
MLLDKQIIRLTSLGSAQLYLCNARLTIQELILSRSSNSSIDQPSGFPNPRKLQDLDAILTTIESWIIQLNDLPIIDWVGVTVDSFAQYTHCLVVAFKLTTLAEPGWQPDEVRRRADVLSILDRSAALVECVPAATGIVDADGPRKGIFTKTTDLIRRMKALFQTELDFQLQPENLRFDLHNDSHDGTPRFEDPPVILDEEILSLLEEPWLADILRS